MFNPAELFIGLRYLRARQQNHYVSFISLISLLGIAVGVAALIVVISVMNGFGNELRTRLLSLTSHVSVTGTDGTLRDWRSVLERARQAESVTGAAPYVEGEGMLANGADLSGALVSGVDPAIESEVSGISDSIVAGSFTSLEPGSFRVILGSHLAYKLGIDVGDRINLMVPRGDPGGTGIVPVLQRLTVGGVFEAGIQDHDSVRAWMHIDDAATLFIPEGGVSGVRLSLADIFRARQVAEELQAMLGDSVVVNDWTRQQEAFFRAIKIEKLMMFVILLLIVAVAAFNIVATLVMVVTDKRNDIAILRTLGMPPGGVMLVFITQGLAIGALGVFIGVALGAGIALNIETLVPRLESLLHVKLLPEGLYYFTSIPSDLRWVEVSAIALTAFLLTSVATIYPARRAAMIQPAEALRYD